MTNWAKVSSINADYFKHYFNISVSVTTTLLAAVSKHEYSKHSKTYIHLKNV